jgi:5-methylcytosine-specific restriction endonuclease McrA
MARGFSKEQRQYMLEAQGGKCAGCYRQIAIRNSEGDHVIPWRSVEGTNVFNGQMLCMPCHREKTKLQAKNWIWDKPTKEITSSWMDTTRENSKK